MEAISDDVAELVDQLVAIRVVEEALTATAPIKAPSVLATTSCSVAERARKSDWATSIADDASAAASVTSHHGRRVVPTASAPIGTKSRMLSR